MQRLISRFMADDNGATAIEYGLILALIAVAILGALSAFGNANTGAFAEVVDRIVAALNQGS